VWAYRNVDGRVRSAVRKFGNANLKALSGIAAGEGLDSWQAGGLSEDRLALIRRFDFDIMSPESAAALFWFLRNSLFFDLALHQRNDVALASYEETVSDPERAMRALCGFLDFPYRPSLISHIDARASGPEHPLDLDPEVRALCDDLEEQLARTYRARTSL
jgi:hypothetical protein